MKRHKHYKNRVEHATALVPRYFGREPATRDEWIQVVAHAIDVGRQLAAAQWSKRLKDAEQRISNLSSALGKHSPESTSDQPRCLT